MDQPFSYDKYFRKNFHFLAIFEAPLPPWNTLQLSPIKPDRDRQSLAETCPRPSLTKIGLALPSPIKTNQARRRLKKTD